MLNIVLYSNNSAFLSDFSRDLAAKLDASAGPACKIRKASMMQTSFFDGDDLPEDLIVVDICDDPARGMEFLTELPRAAGTEVIIIAPTPEYAMQAYDAEVLSYQLAPADAARTARIILKRFARLLQPPAGQVTIPTAAGTQVLPAERVVYMEYDDHRMIVHTDRGRRIVTSTMRASFGDLAAQLAADPRFVRTHASYLINIQHVVRVERFSLVLDTGAKVPIAHARRRAVREQFGRFFRSGV